MGKLRLLVTLKNCGVFYDYPSSLDADRTFGQLDQLLPVELCAEREARTRVKSTLGVLRATIIAEMKQRKASCVFMTQLALMLLSKVKCFLSY